MVSSKCGSWGLIAAAALAMTAGKAVSQNALIDDFEGGTNQNKFMSYWFYYNDSGDKGTSKVLSSLPGATPTELLFDPTVSIGLDEKGGKAAKIDYEMGAAKLSCGPACEFGQYVGMGMDMSPAKKPVDLTGATKITYKAKADKATSVVVEVSIAGVSKLAAPYKFATHQITHNIGTTWKTFEMSMSPTALTNALARPSWVGAINDTIPFNPKEVEKIQWKISMDATTNPTKGVVLIDSVVVHGYRWLSPYACATCVGAAGGGAGELLSDFEAAPQNQNKAGFYWYAYNDAEGRTVSSQAEYSEIFGGVTPPVAPATTPSLTIGGKKGSGGGEAAWIDFILGPTYLQGAQTIRPFVGVGTRLGDDLGVSHFNGTGSTGVSFDYITTGPDIDYIRVEVQDERTLGGGIVHFTLLPGTEGVWKSASIPWASLQLPDYAEVALIADKTLHIQSLSQIQWAFQGDPKKAGTLAVDNVKIMGLTQPITPDLVGIRAAKPGQRSGLDARLVGGKVQVRLDMPVGIRAGTLELRDMRGSLVASRAVTAGIGSSQSLELSAGKSTRGVHILSLRVGASAPALSRLIILE